MAIKFFTKSRLSVTFAFKLNFNKISQDFNTLWHVFCYRCQWDNIEMISACRQILSPRFSFGLMTLQSLERWKWVGESIGDREENNRVHTGTHVFFLIS